MKVWQNVCFRGGTGSATSSTGLRPGSRPTPSDEAAKPIQYVDEKVVVPDNNHMTHLGAYREQERGISSGEGDIPIIPLIAIAVAGLAGVCCVYAMFCKHVKVPERSNNNAPDGSRPGARRQDSTYETETEVTGVSSRDASGKASADGTLELDQAPVSARGLLRAAHGKQSPQKTPSTVYGKDADNIRGQSSQGDVRSPRDINIEMDDSKSGTDSVPTKSVGASDRVRIPARVSQASRQSRPEQSMPSSTSKPTTPKVPQPESAAPPPPPKSSQSSPRAEESVIRKPLVPPPVGLPDCAADSGQRVYEQLQRKAQASESERKAVLRELQLSWHPDKNSATQKEASTAIFQYISTVGPAFLKGRKDK